MRNMQFVQAMAFFQDRAILYFCLFKEVSVRYKYTIFLIILLLGTLFISSQALHPTKAAGQFAPVDVGSLPPLIRVSHLLGRDRTDRTLQVSVGLNMRNQNQLNTLLHDLYDPSSPR